jgi:hypothetical protein
VADLLLKDPEHLYDEVDELERATSLPVRHELPETLGNTKSAWK